MHCLRVGAPALWPWECGTASKKQPDLVGKNSCCSRQLSAKDSTICNGDSHGSPLNTSCHWMCPGNLGEAHFDLLLSIGRRRHHGCNIHLGQRHLQPHRRGADRPRTRPAWLMVKSGHLPSKSSSDRLAAKNGRLSSPTPSCKYQLGCFRAFLRRPGGTP